MLGEPGEGDGREGTPVLFRGAASGGIVGGSQSLRAGRFRRVSAVGGSFWSGGGRDGKLGPRGSREFGPTSSLRQTQPRTDQRPDTTPTPEVDQCDSLV